MDFWGMGAQQRAGRISSSNRDEKNWYFIAADYAFGHDLVKQASEAVIEGDGKVLGGVAAADRAWRVFVVPYCRRNPADPDVVALAKTLAPMLTASVKQAAKFSVT